MITVNAKDLHGVLSEIDHMLSSYGLSRLCELYVKKDKLVFHCATTVHYYAYIPFQTQDTVEYNFTFRVTENVRLLSPEGVSILSPTGTVLNIVNLATAINLPIEDNKLEQYKAVNIATQVIQKDACISAIKRIVSYDAISRLLKNDVQIAALGETLQLRQDSVYIRTRIPISMDTGLPVSILRVLLKFLEQTTSVELGATEDVLLFKRENASLYIARKPLILTDFDDQLKGMLPIGKMKYPKLAVKIREIAGVMKNCRLQFILRDNSLTLHAKSANSSVISNFGDMDTQEPTIWTQILPVEVASILFKNLGDDIKVSRTSTKILLESATDQVVLPADVFN
jgi:hypothetical protein